MSDVERISLGIKLEHLSTLIEERENVARCNRTLLWGILGSVLSIGLGAAALVAADHYEQVQIQKTLDDIKPQHERLWLEHILQNQKKTP